MARIFFQAFYTLLALLTLGACSDVNDKNQLAVYVCDSPADYGGVNFYITGVEVRQSGGGDVWTPLAVSQSYVALMELINGKMQETGRGTMPDAASYDACRLTFSTENAHVLVAGESIPLVVDAADAVVTVPFPAVTMGGANRPLLFDIDIASSVVADASVAGGYRFRPQVSFVDIDEYGVVQGGLQVGQTAVSSRIWMTFTNDATGAVSSTYCSINPAGAFFIRLVPGDYTLNVVPRSNLGVKPYAAKVSVTKQGITDLGVIVLETSGL